MRRARLLAPVLAVVAAGAGLTVPASPASAAPTAGTESPRPLTQPGRYRPTGRLQVRFRADVPATAALARVSARGHYAKVVARVPSLNAALLSVDSARAVQRLLRADADVLYVEPESRYTAFTADPTTPERDAAALPDVASREADTALTGAGKEIAVIDSAVDTANSDLTGRVVVSENHAVLPPPAPHQSSSVCDPTRCPHGTAVAAVAAAADDNGGMVGAAPGANISSYNVFTRTVYTDPVTDEQVEESGASSVAIANALDAVRARAVANPGTIAAVNMSLGGPFDSQLVRDAIATLHAAAPGVTVVVAAGNDGGERANYPAGDPYVLSVGASGRIPLASSCNTAVSPSTPWTVTAFSNRGDVDVVAPGRCVTAWYLQDDPDVAGGYETPATLQQVDGTSFAAPMVAGALALMASHGTKPVTGDAARAAILAGATHPATPTPSVGAGALHAANAVAVATGTATYTAAFLTRGGEIANVVGRRSVEALRVDPASLTAPAAPSLTVPAGRGTVSGVSTATSGNVARTVATYAVPADNLGGVTFALGAGGAPSGLDHAAVPIHLLDPADNVEGLPMANNESASVPLTFGTRSAYVRSAAIPSGGLLEWDFTYGEGVNDPNVPPASDLFVWEPSTNGGVADAASEPVWAEASAGSDSDFVYATGGPNADYCEQLSATPPTFRECRHGRYLIGWLTFSPEDNSSATSRYALKFRYANGPTATVSGPANAATVSATGPFTVSWGGLRAMKFDVFYMTKKKSGTSWVNGPWLPWKTKTTSKSAVFGGSNLPVKPVRGQTYHFLVRAFDALGNPSLPAQRNTVVPVDDTDSYVRYGPSWGYAAAGSRYISRVHYSTTGGAYAYMTSETSQFTVIAEKCPTCGALRIYVDNVLKATVDTRASSTLLRQLVWTSPTMGAPRTHTIKIVNLATAGRPRVILDAIGSLR